MESDAKDHNYWIAIAEFDWLLVQNELAATRTPWNLVAFHAHATAEKYLKAFLAFKGIDPPKSHDLLRMLELAATVDTRTGEIKEDCDDLNGHSVDSRYPDTAVAYEEKDARDGVAAAERIRNFFRDRLAIVEP